MRKDPANVTSQNGRQEGKDWIQIVAKPPSEGRCNNQPPEDDEAADGAS